MRRFWVDTNAIHGGSAAISGSDARHIRKVLRLKPGDAIRLLDGTGHEYVAVITGFSPEHVHVNIKEKFNSGNESPLHLIVAQALLKEGKMDGILRQLSEIGVARFVPFISSRSVPIANPDRFEPRLERWRKIARESIKQCRRGIPIQIDSPQAFEQVLELSETCDAKIFFWEEAKDLIPKNFEIQGAGRRSILLMIGPEGGFSQAESEAAGARGFIKAGLGPRILRAETAPVAAAAILQYLFGDMGNKKA